MLHDISLLTRVPLTDPGLAKLDASDLLQRVFADPAFGRIALVSSFGAESVVLLHLISQSRPDLPVLFIDTDMLFAETLAYQTVLAQTLGLTQIRIIRATAEEIAHEDPEKTLHQSDLDACCNLRKIRPLQRALQGFDTWITGRKRYQGGQRTQLPLFETDAASRLKINPLAAWSASDITTYIDRHDLPRHPMVARGYHSIGCLPCTRPGTGRTGRWAGQDKDECGIHFVNGRPQPGAPEQRPGLVIVRDSGFASETAATENKIPELPGETDPQDLPFDPRDHAMIRIVFANFADGRGLTLARDLRRRGYRGCLRACGPLLADQYAMIRRVGFDEVEITTAQARRQPEHLWKARANWQAHDYQSRLRGWTRGPQQLI